MHRRLQRRRTRLALLLFGDEMRRLTAAFVLFATPAAAAEAIKFPIPIPQECFTLASREGVPTMIESRYQLAKAKLKLARLSDKDPMVRDCRAAVNRARQAYEAAKSPQQAGARAPEAAMRPVGMQGPDMMRNPEVRTNP
jgi:hypothetical protein